LQRGWSENGCTGKDCHLECEDGRSDNAVYLVDALGEIALLNVKDGAMQAPLI
jgi:hypothetical protein